MKKEIDKTKINIYNKIGVHFVRIHNIIDLSNIDKESADKIRNEIKLLSDLVDKLYMYDRKEV